MKPPETLDVADSNNGFTILVKSRNNGEYTLWRPKGNRDTLGTLVKAEPSFYQNNDNCTLATYKIKKYRFPILVWFDNATGERIA